MPFLTESICDTSKREAAEIMRVRMRPPRNPAGISIIKPLEWSSCVHSNRINIRQNPSRRFQLLCNVKLAINPKCPENERIFCPSLPERDAPQRAATVDNSSSAAIREVCGTPMALSLVLRAIYFFSPLLPRTPPHFRGSIILCAFVAKTITPLTWLSRIPARPLSVVKAPSLSHPSPNVVFRDNVYWQEETQKLIS